MNIFNRPPTIAEDTLQYSLIPPTNMSDKASVTTFAACIDTFVHSLLPGFIWHRDAFEVKVVPNTETESWMLEGRMRVGDCVDDEWCVVWLLKEISSKWDLATSVYDSDGEFLLIEAAESLPSWVKPSISENRVWIYNSRIHLIPLSHTSPPSRKHRRRKLPGATDSDGKDAADENEDFIVPEDAVRVVRDISIDTYAPQNVENAIVARISGYPDAAKNHVHNTKVYIPIGIARALSANAHLVQKAVETFYTRDAIQLRAAHRMSRFPPDTNVLQPVKMTRTAYAQLVGQKFFPPKVFGRWPEKEGSEQWRWRDVGMKIAVGFEILYQESKGRLNTNVTADGVKSSVEANKDALHRSPEYQKYIENLKSAGYFRNEIEGSELWRSLENKAAVTYVDVRRIDNASRRPFAVQVEVAISEAVELPQPDAVTEDADDWLNVNEQDFEHVLEKKMGAKTEKSINPNTMDVDDVEEEDTVEDQLASEQASKLGDLANKVQDFIEGEGDLEGARFEDEEFSDEVFSDDYDEGDTSDSSDNMNKEERSIEMANLVPALDPADYGKMPSSYYSNSQRVVPTNVASENVSTEENKPNSDTQHRPIRKPILPRDNFDGVDSDDETDEDEEEEDEEEDDRPQVVGDIEIDMGEEEEEFLEFSRQALGITDAHWNDIVQDRKGRGAFLPASVLSKSATTKKSRNPRPTDKSGSLKTETSGGKSKTTMDPESSRSVNTDLDSFEKVMDAINVELVRFHDQKDKGSTSKDENVSSKAKKGKEPVRFDVDEMNREMEDMTGEDIEATMDAELKAVLEREDLDDDDEDEVPMDYNLIKNFLESFKSQGGLSGPVSNLAGRLQPGWKLPRDEY